MAAMSQHYIRVHSQEARERKLRKLQGDLARYRRISAKWLGRSLPKGVPAGFRQIQANVYTNGNEIVVTCHPDAICKDEGWHNCDEMGCRWEHVVLRGKRAKELVK